MGNSAVPKHQLLCQEGSFKPRIRPPTAKLQPKAVLSHSRGQDPTFHTDPQTPRSCRGRLGSGDGSCLQQEHVGSRQHLLVPDGNCSKGCLLGGEEAAPGLRGAQPHAHLLTVEEEAFQTGPEG